jgi:hypothetical protein
LGLELAYIEQVEAEGLDLSQDAVQRGLVQEPGEHGVRAVPPRRHRRECGQHVAPRCPLIWITYRAGTELEPDMAIFGYIENDDPRTRCVLLQTYFPEEVGVTRWSVRVNTDSMHRVEWPTDI